MSESPTPGQRAGRWALSALGWVATAVCVLAILFLLGEQSSGSLPSALRVGLGLALGGGVVVTVVLAVVYVVTRARNRRSDTAGGALPDSPRARAVQRAAGSLLDRLDSSAAGDNAVRRILLTDRVQLTAAALEELDTREHDRPEHDGRWDALSFIWTVRPAQVADFSGSPQFHNLPLWAQDAVVLLDLRRDLQLRGADAALTGRSGFYAHPFEHYLTASSRTGNTELASALTRAQQTITASRRPSDEVQRLVDLLDDDSVWARVVSSSD